MYLELLRLIIMKMKMKIKIKDHTDTAEIDIGLDMASNMMDSNTVNPLINAPLFLNASP